MNILTSLALLAALQTSPEHTAPIAPETASAVEYTMCYSGRPRRRVRIAQDNKGKSMKYSASAGVEGSPADLEQANSVKITFIDYIEQGTGSSTGGDVQLAFLAQSNNPSPASVIAPLQGTSFNGMIDVAVFEYPGSIAFPQSMHGAQIRVQTQILDADGNALGQTETFVVIGCDYDCAE